MSIKIRERKIKNGKSLFLDIIHNGRRYYEFLNIHLRLGTSPKIIAENKEWRDYAEIIANSRWGEILTNTNGIEFLRKKKDEDLLKYFFEIVAKMEEGSNKTIYDSALKQLSAYHKKTTLYPSEVTERYLEGFYDHLEKKYKGETPITYFKRLKNLLGEATKDKHFTNNPASEIRGRRYVREEKPTLTEEEIKALVNTNCRNEDVKYGFLFSCNTGLRFSDVKLLKWKDIKGNSITLIQRKTKNKVDIELSEDAVTILSKQSKKNDIVFNLPTHRGCLMILHKWVEDARITKKIGWHNSRHTLGTTLADKGVDIYTISKTLGHRSITPTQRYVRESVKQKKEAIMKLPKLL